MATQIIVRFTYDRSMYNVNKEDRRRFRQSIAIALKENFENEAVFIEFHDGCCTTEEKVWSISLTINYQKISMKVLKIIAQHMKQIVQSIVEAPSVGFVEDCNGKKAFL